SSCFLHTHISTIYPSSSQSTPHHPHPHSFPTRRSSDLRDRGAAGAAHRRLHANESGGGTLRVGFLSRLRRPRGGAEGAIRIQHRSEEHTSELQSLTNLVCRLLLEKKKTIRTMMMLYRCT